THIYAPIHFGENKRYLEDIDLKELVFPLIVLDVSTVVANNNDFIVTRSHLEAWEKEHGTIDPGTFVVLRTDWSKRWSHIEKFENKDSKGQQHA
ncbi:cyclase family protein, partial [Staphylococcus aureus]|uniref:cyclase family protein n=1 Tax=Staphylococcus aureus TaxID=1280 RepID=UPI001022F460